MINGYSLISETYKKAKEAGRIPAEEARAKIRVYDFLAQCSDSDIDTLFDSTAFNWIVKAYVKRATEELIKKDVLDEEQAQDIRREVKLAMEDFTAKRIMEVCG